MNSSLHHSFDIAIAEEYGIEEAILIHHFQHWIMINKRMGTNKHEGATWTYQTQKWIIAHFPYWKNRKKIERLIRSLIDKKVIKTGNFNKSSYDRTTWYAFNDEHKFLIGIQEDKMLFEATSEPMDTSDHSNGQGCPMERMKVSNGMEGSGPPIPDTKTDTKTKIDIPDGISSHPHKKCERDDTNSVFFNRTTSEFENLNEERMSKLRRAYPCTDIEAELVKIKLWLEENPKGKRRKGTWKFVLDWFSRSSEYAKYAQGKKVVSDKCPKNYEYGHLKPRRMS